MGFSLDASPPQHDCFSYNVSALRIEQAGQGWYLTDGNSSMSSFRTEEQAEAALSLAKRFSAHCFIGRDNDRPNRGDYIIEYWR